MNRMIGNLGGRGNRLLLSLLRRSLLGGIAALFTLSLLHLGVWQPLEFLMYNQLFHLRGQQPWSDRVVVIGIDDVSLRQLGRFPWSRQYYTELVNILSEAKPNVIVFDVVFSEPSPDDAQLAKAIRQHGKVVLAQAWDGHGIPWLPTELLEQAAIATGHAINHIDADGITRSITPTILNVPALGIVATRTYSLFGDAIPLPDMVKPLWINWQRSSQNIPLYSFVDVLRHQVPARTFSDKVILIGFATAGLDSIETPFNRNPPTNGVFLHATLINNLFQQTLLRPLHEQSWLTMGLVVAGIVISVIMTHQAVAKQLEIAIRLSLGWILLSFVLFQGNYWLPIAAPLALIGITTVSALFYEGFELEARNRALQHLATHDELTQVANRRYFNEWMQTEWRRSARDRRPFSLILCDVDYFKLYNDTYGHQAGDLCLQKVAKALRVSVKRSADFVARYGGEEFVVILPNTPIEGATRVVNEIQAQVEALKIVHKTSQVSSQVTLSLGIACMVPLRNLSPSLLLKCADEALYQAKQEGRDRYCVRSL